MDVGPGDEVVVPSFTFYASAEAIPPTGARPVFCDVDPDTFCVTARDGSRRADAEDQGGDRRAPVRQRRSGRRDRGARRSGARGRRPGARDERPRRPAGLARDDRDLQLLPLQEPRRVRRRRRDHDVRPGDSPQRVAEPALPWFARQVTFDDGRLQLASRRDPGGDPARPAPAPRRLVRWPAAPPRRTTRRAGLGELVALPRPTAGADPAWHLFVVRTPDPDSLAGRCAERGHRRSQPTTGSATHEQPAMREFAPAIALPATEAAVGTNLAIPISPVLGDAAGRGGRHGGAGAPADERASRPPDWARLTGWPARRARSRHRPHAAAGAPRPPGGRCCALRPPRARAIRLDRPLIASATGSGRWTQSASGPSGRRPSIRTGCPGLPTTVEFGGTSWITTLLAPILAPWPTVIGPSSLAPEPIVTLSSHRRVALAGRKAGAAERHALIQRHVVADLGRLADHHAHPVVDEEAVADLAPPGGSRSR